MTVLLILAIAKALACSPRVFAISGNGQVAYLSLVLFFYAIPYNHPTCLISVGATYHIIPPRGQSSTSVAYCGQGGILTW